MLVYQRVKFEVCWHRVFLVGRRVFHIDRNSLFRVTSMIACNDICPPWRDGWEVYLKSILQKLLSVRMRNWPFFIHRKGEIYRKKARDPTMVAVKRRLRKEHWNSGVATFAFHGEYVSLTLFILKLLDYLIRVVPFCNEKQCAWVCSWTWEQARQ